MLSDHGQTQGATFKQRNGYGLDELVRRSLERGDVAPVQGGDENDATIGHAVREATGKRATTGVRDVTGKRATAAATGRTAKGATSAVRKSTRKAAPKRAKASGADTPKAVVR